MHQLTIDHASKPASITDHPSFDHAHRALLRYVVRADYYLRPVPPPTAAHTRYELLRPIDLDDPKPAPDPRVTGVATIEQRFDTGLPAAAFAARDAQRWISDHAGKWLHGSATDPGYHYPMAVLTMARGEARCYLSAGTLLPEAARLAGLSDAAHLNQAAADVVRHNAITDASDPESPAAIAAAVTRLLPADTNDEHTAALSWYYALLRWGVRAP
jgi:hypothetical protein